MLVRLAIDVSIKINRGPDDFLVGIADSSDDIPIFPT